MGGANGWRIETNSSDWMRQVEKRILHEERRPRSQSAAATLGPGFSQNAVLVYDWNAEPATYSGIWASLPGEGTNAPNNNETWIGESMIAGDGTGIQVAYSVSDPSVGYIRSITLVDGVQTFGTWDPIGAGGGGGTPSGPAGGDLEGTYPNPSLAAGAVATDEIADGAVTSNKIADGTIAPADLSPATLNALMLDVADEGTTVVTDATRINFIGGGVVATNDGAGGANVTVTGGGAGGGFTICTSTTRPVSPATGSAIYETNTGMSYVYDGEWRALNYDELIAVDAASIASGIALTGTYTLDGVALTAGMRVLATHQASGADNGIYVVAAGAWARAADANDAAEVGRGKNVRVLGGTQNKERLFTQISAVTTVGTDTQTWRVTANADLAGSALNFPQPMNQGHLTGAANSRTMHMWDQNGVAWLPMTGNVVCTSTTRPTIPSTSNIIYETDTGKAYVFDGIAWQPLTSGGGAVGSGMAWGSVRGTTDGFPGNSTWVPLSPLTLTGLPVGGRAIVAATSNMFVNAVGGWAQTRIVSNQATIQYASMAKDQADVVNQMFSQTVFAIVTATAANPQIAVEGLGTTGTVTIDQTSHITAWPTSSGSVPTIINHRALSATWETVPNNAEATLGFNTSLKDVGGVTYNTGTGVFTIPTTGRYLLLANVQWYPFAAAGRRLAYIKVNGVTKCQSETLGSTVSYMSCQPEGVFDLVAGDQVQVAVYQTSGSTGIIYGDASVSSTTMLIEMVGSPTMSGAWQAYTPTVSGFTVGASTATGRYARIGNTVHWTARITLGAGFAMSNVPLVSKPVAGASTAAETVRAIATDVGVTSFDMAGTTNTTVAAAYVRGTNGALITPTATLPFTWVVGDFIEFAGTYEAA